MKIHKKIRGGGVEGVRVGMGGQGGCDRRIDLFVKILKKIRGGEGRVWGQGGCQRRNEVFVKIQKTISGAGEGGSGSMLTKN